MASLLVSIAGAWISSGGSKGAFEKQLGLMAVDALFGKKNRVEGPRLSNLSVQTTDPGTVIPSIYGTVRCAGNIVWTQAIYEHKRSKNVGGKGIGGEEQITYTYTWSGALMVCGPCDQVLEIWANQSKIYDYNGGTQKGYVLTHNVGVGSWTHQQLRIYTGTETQLPDPLIETNMGVGNTPAYRGCTYVVFENLALGQFGNSLPIFTFKVKKTVADVAAVAADILAQVNIPSTAYDVSALSGVAISGMVLSERTPAKTYLQMLEKAFYCRFVEYDYKIRAILLGSNSPLTLSLDEVGFVQPGGTTAPTERSTTQALDLPFRIECAYLDSDRMYNQSMQFFARQITETQKKESFNLPIVLTGAQARQIAQSVLLTRWNERTAYNLQLGFKYLYLVPGDSLVVPTNQGNFTVRIEQLDKMMLGQLKVGAVLYDPSTYGTNVPTLADPGVPVTETPVKEYPIPTQLFFDCHVLADDDVLTPGFYVAMTVPVNANSRGFTLTGPTIIPGDYTNGNNHTVSIPDLATMGVCNSVLADDVGHGFYMDTTHTLTVSVYDNGASNLTSVTDADIIQGPVNVILVGNEILQFATATFVGYTMSGTAKQYTLSRFLRGRKGTESFMPTHIAAEPFVLLDGAIARVRVSASQIGVTNPYDVRWGYANPYTSGVNAVGGIQSVNIITNGLSLKPFSVGGLRGDRDMVGNLSVEWFPRTRYNEQYFRTGRSPADSVPTDLSAYKAEVLNGSTLIRTTLVNATTWYYSWAQQLIDFAGSPPGTVTIRVSRMSSISTPVAVGGQGYPASQDM